MKDLALQGSAFARDKKKYAAELKEYFAGKRIRFTSEFDLAGTEFQKSVWMELRNVPFGETITYGELAKRIGRPRAVRAVASAVARNPVGIVIPCHRIVPASAKTTAGKPSRGWPGKFAWGSDLKKWLLEHEKKNA